MTLQLNSGANSMRESDVIELSTVQELFIDGLTDIHIVGRNFKCTYYSMQAVAGFPEPQKVAILKIVIPLSNVMDCVMQVTEAVRSPPAMVAEFSKRVLS